MGVGHLCGMGRVGGQVPGDGTGCRHCHCPWGGPSAGNSVSRAGNSPSVRRAALGWGSRSAWGEVLGLWALTPTQKTKLAGAASLRSDGEARVPAKPERTPARPAAPASPDPGAAPPPPPPGLVRSHRRVRAFVSPSSSHFGPKAVLGLIRRDDASHCHPAMTPVPATLQRGRSCQRTEPLVGAGALSLPRLPDSRCRAFRCQGSSRRERQRPQPRQPQPQPQPQQQQQQQRARP